MNPIHAGPRMTWGRLLLSVGTMAAFILLAAAKLVGWWVFVFFFLAEFVVYQAFSALIRHRRRDLALLRCFGASRGQVFAGVLAEAAFIGLLAMLAGAGGAVVMLDGQGIAIFVFAGVVCVGGAVLAAIVPAVRASRVPPTGLEGNGRV